MTTLIRQLEGKDIHVSDSTIEMIEVFDSIDNTGNEELNGKNDTPW